MLRSLLFCTTGQSCVAGSRLLVEESIKDEFVQRLVERVQTIKLVYLMRWQPSLDHFVPYANAKIEQVIASSIQQGANFLLVVKALSEQGITIHRPF